MRLIPLISGLAAASFLSGCAVLDALRTADLADDLAANGVLDNPTADSADVLARTGTATYTGLGAVGFESATNRTGILGEARVNADFDANTMDGTLDLYRGMEVGLDVEAEEFLDIIEADPEGTWFDMDSASGTVTLANGTITGSTFSVDVDGDDLTMAGVDYTVTGTTVGEFTTGTEVADGIRTTGSAVTGTIDGDPAVAAEIYFAAAE